MITKATNLPTLRWKKTIGILTIILGGLRFGTGIEALVKILLTEVDIQQYGVLKYGTEAEALQEVAALTRNLIIIELLEVATLFVLGIVLLSVERGLTDGMPRPKSRNLAYAILITAIIHALTEISVLIRFQLSISLAFSLVWVFMLIIFCWLGLGESHSAIVVDYATGEENLSARERSMLKKIKQEERLAEDLAIAALRKKVMRRRLEKELQQIDLEERAIRIREDELVNTETEQLKKELAELE